MRAAFVAALVLVGCSGSGAPQPTAPVTPKPTPSAPVADTCPEDVARAHVPTAEEKKTIPNSIVRAVCIVGVGPEGKRTASALIGVKQHAPLTLQQVMEDTHKLMASDAFDDVVVAAVPREREVIVVYQLKERKRLAEVVVEGADEVAAKTVELKRGAPLAPWDVGRATAALHAAYAERGNHGVKITPSVEPVGDAVRVRLVVVPGPRWTFGPATVTGATKIPTAKLVEAAAAAKGKPFDETELNRTAYLVERVYSDRGYLKARIGAQAGTASADGIVPVTFSVETEGPQFKVSKVSLDKLDPDVAKAARGKLASKAGDFANVSAMVKDKEMIEKLYGTRGGSADISFATHFDDAKSTLELVFEKTR